MSSKKKRVDVRKTYKLYIDGQFPRTESGRYFKLKGKNGKFIANMCRGSRKDFRAAGRAAGQAFSGWSARPYFNRGQILYRMAEMLEERKGQFLDRLQAQGIKKKTAQKEVEASIDRLVYYAGWSDKYTQVMGAVNPVASSHFNFSVPEPTGVVAAFAPQDSPLLGFVTLISSIVVGGNTCVILASEKYPISAMIFAEVLNDSDVPGGVINILTGHKKELLDHFSTHMDVKAVVYADDVKKEKKALQENCSRNVKRFIHAHYEDWNAKELESPYLIMKTQETKTTWHPIGT
jgi:acyl-CoA reductase-like NAD-dependent aldehyde dehydrogenase